MDFLEAFVIDVGVDLSGYYAGVPQQFLHDPQVRSARKQVRRETMPQGMRRHLGFQACDLGVLLDQAPDG